MEVLCNLRLAIIIKQSGEIRNEEGCFTSFIKYIKFPQKVDTNFHKWTWWTVLEQGQYKKIFCLPLFTHSFSDFFYWSLFVPDQSASLSSCPDCQYITGGPIFWLNEVSRDMSAVRGNSSEDWREETVKLDFRIEGLILKWVIHLIPDLKEWPWKICCGPSSGSQIISQ